jgi:hypothetical protein
VTSVNDFIGGRDVTVQREFHGAIVHENGERIEFTTGKVVVEFHHISSWHFEIRLDGDMAKKALGWAWETPQRHKTLEVPTGESVKVMMHGRYDQLATGEIDATIDVIGVEAPPRRWLNGE